MVIVSLICESISVFAFLCSRENFSAQSKGLFLRNNYKMPRQKMTTCDFYKKRHKDREFQSQKSKSKSSFGNEVEFLINCSLPTDKPVSIFHRLVNARARIQKKTFERGRIGPVSKVFTTAP